MKSIRGLIAFALLSLTFVGCEREDADYKSGIYWLRERDNWQSAVQAFERSLARYPDRWKTNLAMIEALAHGDDPDRLERQLSEVFKKFPDSTRSAALVSASSELLGERRVVKLGGDIELQSLERELGSKGDTPRLLSRAIIAACRAENQSAVSEYLGRLLEETGGEIADSVEAELGFFIGSAQLAKIRLSARLLSNPADTDALIGFARASMLTWEPDAARKSLIELAHTGRNYLGDESITREFSALWNILPFESRNITQGWDGARGMSGARLVFLRDLGTLVEPDRYIFRNDGSSDLHTMKGAQQGLRELALPRLSRDNSWIYFYSSTDKNWQPGGPGRFNLYRIKPTYGAAPVRLTDDDLIYCDPYFEADGSILAVRRDVGSVRQSAEVFRIMPEKRRAETVIRIAEPVQWACFTPSADSLMFITSRGIYKRALTGGPVVLEMAGQGFSYPLISPDGKWLLIQGPSGEQFLINRSNGHTIYLGAAFSPMGYFSPGKSLIVTRESNGRPMLVEFDLEKPALVSDKFEKAMRGL